MHSGRIDPREIGRKGGQQRPATALRREAGKDDELRELARETLAAALRGEDVDKAQLDAARSLFAYRAAAPPSEGEYSAPEHVTTSDGSRVLTLGDVLQWAYESGGSTAVVADGWIRQGLQARRAFRRRTKR